MPCFEKATHRADVAQEIIRRSGYEVCEGLSETRWATGKRLICMLRGYTHFNRYDVEAGEVVRDESPHYSLQMTYRRESGDFPIFVRLNSSFSGLNNHEALVRQVWASEGSPALDANEEWLLRKATWDEAMEQCDDALTVELMAAHAPRIVELAMAQVVDLNIEPVANTG